MPLAATFFEETNLFWILRKHCSESREIILRTETSRTYAFPSCVFPSSILPSSLSLSLLDMISTNVPTFSNSICVPNDMSQLSVEAITAGMVEAALDGLGFVSSVLIDNNHTLRTLSKEWLPSWFSFSLTLLIPSSSSSLSENSLQEWLLIQSRLLNSQIETSFW